MIQNIVNIVPWKFRDQIRKIPVLSWLQRKLFKTVFKGDEFIYEISAGPAKGLTMALQLPRDKLYWTGTWEREVSEVIASKVQKGKPALDIGSHRGFVAGVIGLAGAYPVIAAEPNPANLESLYELKSLNPELDLQIQSVAIGKADGTASFAVMPDSAMGKLSDSEFQADAASQQSFDVTVRSLDSLAEELALSDVGFIKIDVEGAELDVLEGGENLLKKARPNLIIEIHTFELWELCRSHLEKLGYQHITLIERGYSIEKKTEFRVCHMMAVYD